MDIFRCRLDSNFFTFLYQFFNLKFILDCWYISIVTSRSYIPRDIFIRLKLPMRMCRVLFDRCFYNEMAFPARLLDLIAKRYQLKMHARNPAARKNKTEKNIMGTNIMFMHIMPHLHYKHRSLSVVWISRLILFLCNFSVLVFIFYVFGLQTYFVFLATHTLAFNCRTVSSVIFYGTIWKRNWKLWIAKES